MNPNNHFSNFQPPGKVSYFPNIQCFPPPPQSHNQALIIPPNFPSSLMPSLHQYLSSSNSPLHRPRPIAQNSILQPGVLQYPSIVSPLRQKAPKQSKIQVTSSALLPASGGSPYLSNIPQEKGHFQFNIRPVSTQMNDIDEKIKNKESGERVIVSKEKKSPLVVKESKITEGGKKRIDKKITSQEKPQEQRFKKGYSIASEEQKYEELMGSCLSFTEIEQMKLKHQGIFFLPE